MLLSPRKLFTDKYLVPPKHKGEGLQVSWTTVTYRSVLLAILAVVVAVSIALSLIFPEQSKSLAAKTGNMLNRVLNRANQAAEKKGNDQATFTQIDGTVRVKKANSNTWVNADYQTRLEKGDVIQTGSEGLAKVVFPDRTYYTIKQDSLIVIEENSTNTAQQTNVSVELTTGTVDLSTGSLSQGSKSQVVLAGARANLASESTAMVHNDPRTDQHEILAKKGSVEVVRGNEIQKLTEYERASFKQETPGITKTKELAPPTLIAPANMLPVFVQPGSNSVLDFSWTPVTNAVTYRMRISRNPYFSSTVYDRKVPVSQVKVPALSEEGGYYWTVQSVDGAGRESVESEKNKFQIIAKGAEAVALQLDLEPFVQHGHTIEVRGKTEPNARVMVNGFEVPSVRSDGTFSYFTPSLPSGESVITITAQNTKGGVKNITKKVVIQ